MLSFETPLEWRKDWALYRSNFSVDSRGTERRTYPEEPDYIGHAGTASGVCWQIKSSNWTPEEPGEQARGSAAFKLFNEKLSIKAFDRCVFGGYLWEVRSVIRRSGWRNVELVEVEAVGG